MTEELKLDDFSQIPGPMGWLRAVNLAVSILLVILIWNFNGLTFLIGILGYSGSKMPFIYVFTLFFALISSLLAIGGNGHHTYIMCLISAPLMVISGLVLLNTQVYLYTLGLKVLGSEVVFKLMNVFHYWMIFMILLLFLSGFLVLMIAIQIKEQKEWLKQHRLIWPNDHTIRGDSHVQTTPMPAHPNLPIQGFSDQKPPSESSAPPPAANGAPPPAASGVPPQPQGYPPQHPPPGYGAPPPPQGYPPQRPPPGYGTPPPLQGYPPQRPPPGYGAPPPPRYPLQPPPSGYRGPPPPQGYPVQQPSYGNH